MTHTLINNGNKLASLPLEVMQHRKNFEKSNRTAIQNKLEEPMLRFLA